MALQHLRSSTANKRPLPAGMSDGQLAVNTNLGSPGLFFKDSNGDLVKVGPVHVGATAPNASPAAGGATGNTKGEQWLDTSGTNPVLKVWDGSAWQSEAGEFVNASGDTMTGALVMDNQQQVRFRETTANGTNYVAIQAPASVGADRTLTLPDVSGTIVSTGDTGTVTSTMIADGTIVNGDINASAAIAGTKISPDFGSQTVTTTGVISAAAGAEGTPSIAFTGDTNTGLYSPGADQVAISTGGSGRLFVNAGGDVGVRSAAVGFPLEVRSRSTTDSAQVGLTALNWSTNYSSTYLQLFDTAATGSTFGISNANSGQLVFQNHANAIIGTNNATPIIFATQSSERLRITSAGLVGVGTSSPSELLHVSKDQNAITAIKVTNPNTGASAASYLSLESGTKNVAISAYNAGSSFQIQGFGGIVTQYQDFDTHIWRNNAGTERARIDSSGRLLVGTSSALTTISDQPRVQVFVGDQGAASYIRGSANEFGPNIHLAKTRSTTPGVYSVLQSGDELGSIFFIGDDGSDLNQTGARISAAVDGTPGANDMPGRLVFSTTKDGQASPTEALRIDSQQRVGIGKTPDNSSSNGVEFWSSGVEILARSSGTCLYVNRNTSDGTIVEIQQDAVQEGSISVSGTTVSYNGAHLSRWSQLPSGAERTEILRGSVLSNIDEMCEWGEEDNEQLNRMKVSDVEGDKNVSGVFQAWDDDDDTYTNDFYCAMTGDFIIRIAAGVAVERGDLLMSAGDGTAKPQDDDIIRSKTIAKVTSTNVSCTYNDGSYCVPCVLMAC